MVQSAPMSDNRFLAAFARLERSAFRRRFRLTAELKRYAVEKGLAEMRRHAEAFVRERLAAARPRNDGRQTPMKGHPVFLAQHATATCCRGCLNRWWHVPIGVPLTAAQQTKIVNLIMAWLLRQLFACRCCGACCRIPDGIVRVSDDEIARIAAFLGQSEKAFIATETELAPDRKGLILKSRADGACAYLSDDNRCRIHPVKPDKCRTFPYEWTNPDSIQVCPGLQACSGRQLPLEIKASTH